MIIDSCPTDCKCESDAASKAMMANILKKILDDKKIDVEQRRKQVKQEYLETLIAGQDRPRNFFKAVTKDSPRGMNLIAEIKRASPSAGLIRENFDPADIARQYHRAGADAISVLTDEKYFQGSLAYIDQVKQAVPVPVMRKDFIIDPYQVYESRAAGADAILLIAEAMPPGMLMDMLILSSRLKLSALVEVHKAESLLKLRSLVGFPLAGYSVLGINNRDLETFRVDITTTSRLSSMLSKQPGLVSESGIKTRRDIERLKEAGCTAVLIGQTLMEAENIEAKIEELLGPMPGS